MKHFLHLMSNFKSHLNIAIWIVFAFFLIHLTSCEEKEDPLPEGFERVAGFQLSAFDSIFVVWPGDQELNLTPKFSAAFGEEVILPTLPSMQFYIDGKRASNPPRIPTDKVREFEIYATIGKLRSKILKIKVIDVDPKTYVSGFKASMGDSTKAPYAISGRSLIDFKASILDFKGREFSDENKPAYKFYFDGVVLENHHRVPILRSGEIPFWIEVGGKKSNVGILYSRELPDLSKKYSLPIIFHIIHSGQAVGTSENPSKERITQLLNQTNDWMMGRTKSESRKGHNQVDPNIEFFPASVGPDGKALEEPGIHRIFSEKRSWVGDLSIKNFLFDQM